MSDETDDQDPNLLNRADDGSDDTTGQGSNDSSADDGDIKDGSDSSNDDGGVKNLDDITDPDELREMLKGTRSQNTKLFARIQDGKGFRLDKKTGKWVPKTTQVQSKPNKSESSDQISSQDLYVLIEAKVPKEDISEVIDYSKLKGISVEEALKSNVVKSILSERGEERTTANATSTGPTRRGSTKVSAGELLKKASETGEVPESDEDMGNLVEARLAQRIGNK